MLDDMRQGKDPSKRADRNMTLKTALDDYIKSAKLRPASVRTYRIIERTLKDWLDIPLRTITRDMVAKRHAELGAKSPTTANTTFRAFRLTWNRAADKIDDLPSCPVSALRQSWFAEPRRRRMVASGQLADFYAAVQALPNPIHRDAIVMLMFSGMRIGECRLLRWDDIDFKERLINLKAESTKADRDCLLPMNDVVHDLLVARRALGRDKFVFPGGSKAGHVATLQSDFEIIAEKTGITISAHDLRRGFASAATRVGVPLPILKMLLNHAPSADVTEGYVVAEMTELRAASQKIADELKRLCGIEAPGGDNVLSLRA